MSDSARQGKTLTRAEIINRLHLDLGLSKREARHMTEHFFEQIVRSLENDEPVKLSGFGNFVLWRKRARIGRNPRTGIEATIAARRVVTFKPGKKLRNRVRRVRTQFPNDSESV